MKEIKGIIAEYDQVDQGQQSLALATVYDVRGSSYRRSGARMLIKDDGNWFGGISGGCIEGNALKRAQLVMADGQARLVTYDTANDDEAGIGVSLGCNGVISVIIAPLRPDNPYNPLKQLRRIINHRAPVGLITILESSTPELKSGSVLHQSDMADVVSKLPELQSIEPELSNVIASGKSRVVETSSLRVFLECLEPEVHLVVMGGNYDVLPVLAIANNLGWKRTVVANPKRLYPPAHKQADQVVESLEDACLDKYSVGLIMSHDYKADLKNLERALQSELSYIGLLGPAVRRNDMLHELKENGTKVDDSRIFGPAGLDIGAAQPEEIALAIIAEIIAVRRQRTAQSLREREVPIHERAVEVKADSR